MIKITFVAIMPSPYMEDFFQTMAADQRFDLRVLYLEEAAPDTYWGKRPLEEYAQYVPGDYYWFLGARLHWNPNILSYLSQRTDDVVVIMGYGGISQYRAMGWCHSNGQPWIFFGERPGMVERNCLSQQLRKFVQRPIRQSSGIAAVGDLAVQSYRELINDQIPIANLPYTCNINEFLNEDTHQLENSISRPMKFLYCGQLIERKGTDLLLQAIVEVAKTGFEFEISLVGTGPDVEKYQAMIPPSLQHRVSFVGFQSVDRLPHYFEQADVFILPSRHDGWGVVINQAVAAGLAVIATDAVGAGHDLVRAHDNGMLIESNSQASITNAILTMISQPDLVSSMKSRSRKMAWRLQPQHSVNLWYEFIMHADLIPQSEIEMSTTCHATQ